MAIKATKRKRGAPRGNQNARKHGFYSKALPVLDTGALTPEQRRDFLAATAIKTIDDEIGIARLKLKAIVADDPQNYAVIMHTIALLARLVKMQKDVSRRDHSAPRPTVDALIRFVSYLISQNNTGSK